MLMKKISGWIVAAMVFAVGMTTYQSIASEPTIVAEATSTSSSASNTGGNKFGLEASMNDKGEITFGNKDNDIKSQKDVWNRVLDVLQTVIQAVGGIGTSLMILFFIINFIKLGQNSANASEVAKIKTAMLWNGIAAAGLGSVTVIFSLFFHMLG